MGNYVISDTHFFHKNIIEYCSRPYRNVAEMNQALIDNWNAVVGKDDLVYHLGDFCLIDYNACERAGIQKRDDKIVYTFNEIRPQLNGQLVLIVGNHDVQKGGRLAQLQNVKVVRDNHLELNVNGCTCLLTHHSIPLEKIAQDGKPPAQKILNLHGHVHQRSLRNGFNVNCSVEVIGYKPVPLVDMVALGLREREYYMQKGKQDHEV